MKAVQSKHYVRHLIIWLADKFSDFTDYNSKNSHRNINEQSDMFYYRDSIDSHNIQYFHDLKLRWLKIKGNYAAFYI